MKERLWSAYYLLMLLYLITAITIWCYFVFNIEHVKYEDEYFRPMSFVYELNKYLFFDFIEVSFQSCEVIRDRPNLFDRFQEVCKITSLETYRRAYVDNIFPFVLVFIMTLIRFIFTGKHIWQRP